MFQEMERWIAPGLGGQLHGMEPVALTLEEGTFVALLVDSLLVEKYRGRKATLVKEQLAYRNVALVGSCEPRQQVAQAVVEVEASCIVELHHGQ